MSIVDESTRIDALPQWFPGVSLNYAENVLYTASSTSPSVQTKLHKEDDRVAIVEVREGLSLQREITWGQLRSRTSLFASAMRKHGVRKGDRVAVVAGNSLDTLIVFLGVTSIGGLFSSSSCDMGTQGILERLRQIKPKWLFVDDATVYNGKTTDLKTKMIEIIAGMKDIPEFKGIISVPRFLDAPRDVDEIDGVMSLKSFLKVGEKGKVQFERVGFMEGCLIVYSSGTTGPPKCIVHGVGGAILNAWKEGGLHRNVRPGNIMMQFTTTGWIMYLISIQTLLYGAKVVMYDGSPFIPRVDTFIQLAGQQKVTHLGVSPRYLQTLQTNNIVPKNIPGISSLEVVTSTGMVLPTSLFAYFYSAHGFPSSTQLANVSGGTDIAGAFADCNPLDPVYESGGCQCRSLATDVRVFDPTIPESAPGKEVPPGGEGELVAVSAFPNMPIKFWGDIDGKKYHSAYFARFDNVWTHGDFISIHPPTDSVLMHGRADGVLNPSGIRFGSAEIYAVVDLYFAAEVEDSVCVGQRRSQDSDERVLLFVKMRPGRRFTADLAARLRSHIATDLSKRHVPAYVFETPEIPVTINAKKVETPLKAILCGRKVVPSGTLANPGCLEWYYRFYEIEKCEEVGVRSRL